MFIFSEKFRGSPDGWQEVLDANFLVGENSTGKSSFGKLVKIIWSSEFQIGNRVIIQSNHINEFSDFMSKLPRKKPTADEFTIGFFTDGNEDGSLGKIATYENVKGEITLKKLTFIDDDEIKKLSYVDGEMRRSTRLLKVISKNQNILKSISDFHTIERKNYKVQDLPKRRPPANFWNFLMSHDLDELRKSEDGFTISQKALDRTDSINDFGPIRSKPERVYFVGSSKFDSEGLASLGALKKSLNNKSFYNSLKNFGKKSGLYDDVEVIDLFEKLRRKAFALKFKKNNVSFYADELGFGVSQVVPIVVEALIEKKRAYLMIEQPELHLHPRAQAAFGELLYEFHKLNHHFIIETHSDFIIDRFRTKIAESKNHSAAKDGQIIFFYKYGKRNLSTTIRMNEDGSYIDTPKRYRDFFLHEQMRVFSAL